MNCVFKNYSEVSTVIRLSNPQQSRPMRIKIHYIFISSGHNFFGHHGQPPGNHLMVEKQEIDCVAGHGLVGDRFFSFEKNYKGQVTFFSIEVFDEICQRFKIGGISPCVTRRNIITAGADLNLLIGGEFQIQGVRFEGVSECKPCYWMDRVIAPGAEEALRGRGGLRARILTDGKIRVDSIG
jgi:hypothetical protein